MLKFLDLRRFRLAGLLIFMIMWISACSGAFPTIQVEQDEVAGEMEVVLESRAPSQAGPSFTPEEIGSEEAKPAVPTRDVSDVTPTDVPVVEEVKQEPEAFVKEQIVATDPGTVSLASGQVQLVEFFAYW